MKENNMANTVHSIKDRFENLNKSIQTIKEKTGRRDDDIHIVAVSKTFPQSALQEAIDNNIMELGENKVQEVMEKIPELRGNFIAHFIGNIQRNKVRQIIKHVSIFHSVYKEETAQTLEKELIRLGELQQLPHINSGYLNIPLGKIGFFIQVNTTDEPTKSGISPKETLHLAEKLEKFSHLEPLGLMTIGPTYGASDENRKAFATLYHLKEELVNKVNNKYRYLSMGMSSDFEDAIKEGATHLRIGSLIFGNRIYS